MEKKEQPPHILAVPTAPEHWSDSSKQSYAYQSPPREYSDRHYTCRHCRKAAVFTGQEQREAYEARKAYIWQARVLCAECFATRMQIEAVRGVDSAGVLRSLVQRGLAEEVGRLEVAGRPILYGVTDLFMQHFGLTKLGELPPLESSEADTLWATTKLAELST